jgi:hypothetical protein
MPAKVGTNTDVETSVIDLEELLEQVRDVGAKEQLREAINCYHSGAYRSAIVSTWVAVVFDFVAKLRELDMTGNQAAQTKLNGLETIRVNHDLPKLLTFEKDLVEEATTAFELISPVESVDLRRLYEDRNRCAHPSLTALDEVFRPAAELARAHIVAAVRNMLSQAPIQGTAAATRVFAEILSDSFPIDPAKAAEYLRHGPLGRAKDTLIRSVVIGVTKDLLTENRPTTSRKKQYATLNAVKILYPGKFMSVVAGNLRLIAERLDDDKTKRLVLYVGQVGGTWEHLGPSCQLKCQNFVESASAETIDASLLRALDVSALRSRAISRINEFGSSALGRMLQGRVEPLFKERCIVLTVESGTFRDAEANLRTLILPYGSILTESDFRRVAEALRDNYQVRAANDTVPILTQLFQAGASGELHRAGWTIVYEVLCTDGVEYASRAQLAKTLAERYAFAPCGNPTTSTDDLDDVL